MIIRLQSTSIKIILSIFLVNFGMINPIWSQESTLVFFQHFSEQHKSVEYKGFTKYSNVESKKKRYLFKALFLFYKNCVSSQDIPGGCNFHPSCSEFGMLALKEYGIIKGVLLTFDRLGRCNGINTEDYSKFNNKGVLIDFPNNSY